MSPQDEIDQAAAVLFDAGVEPELVPVTLALLAREHRYAQSFLFVFCVACRMADLAAQAAGYANQFELAWEHLMARRGHVVVLDVQGGVQ
jgi:hypothetical protein